MRLYDKIHRDVVKAKGKAREHVCVACDRQAAHWSFDGCQDMQWGKSGGYGALLRPMCLHIEHYSPRCHRCHKVFDLEGTNRVPL